jgi:hypothetical protein
MDMADLEEFVTRGVPVRKIAEYLCPSPSTPFPSALPPAPRFFTLIQSGHLFMQSSTRETLDFGSWTVIRWQPTSSRSA